MNRRQFSTALGALATLPTMPLRAIGAAPVAATAVPNSARFWAIYMSQMHGNCSAQTLATMTGLETSVTQSYLTSMINDGIIKPTKIISKIVETQAKNTQTRSKLQTRLKKFLDEKPTMAHDTQTLDQSAEPTDDANETDETA